MSDTSPTNPRPLPDLSRDALIVALQARADLKPCTFPPEDCPKVPLAYADYCDGCLLRAAIEHLRQVDR